MASKRVTVGDWVRVEGEPGSVGHYNGVVRAVTDDGNLIVEAKGSAEIEEFQYCTVIAHFYNGSVYENSTGKLNVMPRES